MIRIIKDEQLFSVFHQLSVLGRNKINKSIFQKIAVKNYLQINLTGARIPTICSLNGSNFSTLSSLHNKSIFICISFQHFTCWTGHFATSTKMNFSTKACLLHFIYSFAKIQFRIYSKAKKDNDSDQRNITVYTQVPGGQCLLLKFA